MSMRLAETLGALSEARAYALQSERWVAEQRAIIEDLELADAGHGRRDRLPRDT